MSSSCRYNSIVVRARWAIMCSMTTGFRCLVSHRRRNRCIMQKKRGKRGTRKLRHTMKAITLAASFSFHCTLRSTLQQSELQSDEAQERKALQRCSVQKGCLAILKINNFTRMWSCVVCVLVMSIKACLCVCIGSFCCVFTIEIQLKIVKRGCQCFKANNSKFKGGGLALFPTHPIPSDGRDREQSTSNGGLIRHEKTLYS